jgi:hypothetical protein
MVVMMLEEDNVGGLSTVMATVAGAQDLAEILNPDAASMELRGFWRRGLPGLDKLIESRGFWRRALTEGPKRKKASRTGLDWTPQSQKCILFFLWVHPCKKESVCSDAHLTLV